MKNYFLLLIIIIQFFSQDNHTGVIYGEDHAYALTAPKGWILDNSSGVNQGLHAVFYPEGGSWSSSPAVMYTNVILKKYEKVENSKEYLDSFLEYYKNRDKGNAADYYKSIELRNYKISICKYFDNKYKNNELVAYIDEAKSIIMIVFVSQDDKLFMEYEPKFIELIESYKFLSSSVKINE